MRTLLGLVAIFLLVTSCSNEDDFGLESTQFVYENQKWELVSMSGSMANSETTGDEMEWQEYYVFKPDGTFLKWRTVNGISTEAKGSFEAIKYENDPLDYLELTFESGVNLAGGCYGNATEILVYYSLSELSSTWLACDGLGLEYALVTN